VALSELCGVMNNHLIGVVPATLTTVALVFLTLRSTNLSPIFRKIALTASGLLIIQILLGVATLRLHLQVEPLTVAHHLVGASLFGTLIAFSALALRDRLTVPHEQSLLTSNQL
jgi:cytochrome c oxidase assembly protein subunit 15